MSDSSAAAPAEPATPAVLAVPAQTGSSPGIDASTHRKFYTLSASLREVYDDNVGTSNSNTQTSYETELLPSVLIDLPSNEGSLTARYTLGLTYYSQMQSGSSGNNNQIEVTHELDAQYAHAFTDRFALNASELFRYFTEPSLDQSTGTVYRSGAYISNMINGTLSAQWTPLFGTSSTYANTIVNYEDATVGEFQNNVENTGTQIFSFAILPKISVSVGGIVDNITYQNDLRGYSNYTAFIGAQWSALPNLSLSGRGGGSYTITASGLTSITPYAALSLNWTLGERSSLSFNYSHEVTPSDQIGAQGQSSDRLNASFSYDITPRLRARLSGVYTDSTIPEQFTTSQFTAVSSQETVYYVDTSLSYTCDKYFSLDAGITLSANQSNLDNQNYTRNEVYAGIRGTY